MGIYLRYSRCIFYVFVEFVNCLTAIICISLVIFGSLLLLIIVKQQFYIVL